jgi:hypothetical protein
VHRRGHTRGNARLELRREPIQASREDVCDVEPVSTRNHRDPTAAVRVAQCTTLLKRSALRCEAGCGRGLGPDTEAQCEGPFETRDAILSPNADGRDGGSRSSQRFACESASFLGVSWSPM